MAIISTLSSMYHQMVLNWKEWRRTRREQKEALSADERKKKRYREILMFAGIVFVLDLLVQLLLTPDHETPMTMLSNGLMIAGLAITSWGLIRLGEYYGSLDALIYSQRWNSAIFKREADTAEERAKRGQSFDEFRRQRQQKRVTPWPLFAVGVPLLAMSVLTAVISMNIGY